MWSRMAEPDGEGIALHPDDHSTDGNLSVVDVAIALHPDDHRRRFIETSEGVIFSQAPPLTEEDRLEADRLWDSIAMPGTSPGTVTPKKKTH